MNEWIQTTLGGIVDKVDERQGKTVVPLVLSVTEKRGIIPQDQVFRTRVATSDTTKYKVLQPLDIAYNPYLLWSNAIGQWKGLKQGVTSPVYETFRVSGNNEPRFVGLLLESGILTSYFYSTAIGSIPRRRRTPVPTFLQASVKVPLLSEQRRIVDVTSAVDVQIDALEEESVLHESVYRSVLTSLVTQHPLVPIVDVVTRATSGGTPSRKRADFFGGDIPWLKSGEVEDDRIETAKEFITKAGLAASSARLVPAGATLVAMYGQGDTKGRAGYVTSPVATNQAVLALTPNGDRVHARYLLHAVRSRNDALRQRAVGAAQPNLSKALVIATEIPLPLELDDQERLANGLDSIRNVIRTVRAELAALRAFRSSLLIALLSQAITIPEAYDAVLEVAA